MIASAFDLGEEIKLRTLEYKVFNTLWSKYALPTIDISFRNWNSIKYLNDAGDDFNPAIEAVPDDKGGLYLFYAQCSIITGMTDYPFYVGRAQLTQNQNLRKRVKEYFSKFSKENERPKITRMFKYWSADLYLAYFVLDENDDVIDFEKMLINSLLLPMNDQIPDQEIRQAVKAFQP
jgi:excinuclease UvrABC nuclease subunit